MTVYIAEPEAVHAHLERGARIAFALLDRSAVALSDEEREWYEFEHKRQQVELWIVKYAADGSKAFAAIADRVPRAEADAARDKMLQRWADMGMQITEPDGARWDIEVRE